MKGLGESQVVDQGFHHALVAEKRDGLHRIFPCDLEQGDEKSQVTAGAKQDHGRPPRAKDVLGITDALFALNPDFAASTSPDLISIFRENLGCKNLNLVLALFLQLLFAPSDGICLA